MSQVSHVTVRAEEDGWRLDRWAKAHYPTLGFGQLQKLCRTGQFRLDGKRIEANARLAPGQVVRVPPLGELPVPAPKPGPRQVRPEDAAFIRSLVVYEDERLIALNKPAGLAVQGGSGTTRHVDGLLDALARKGERPKLVHRLDRDTSGLLVVARTAAAARELSFAFQQHKVRKLYWALLLKGPERNQGLIDCRWPRRARLARRRCATARMRTTGGRRPQRPHPVHGAGARRQGRGLDGADAAHRPHPPVARARGLIGCPILGDGKYGGKDAHPMGAPKGLMLHARELDLPGASAAGCG